MKNRYKLMWNELMKEILLASRINDPTEDTIMYGIYPRDAVRVLCLMCEVENGVYQYEMGEKHDAV